MPFGIIDFHPSKGRFQSAIAGQVLGESLWALFWFAILILGAVVAVNRHWNDRLTQLQQTRLPYDGIKPLRSP